MTGCRSASLSIIFNPHLQHGHLKTAGMVYVELSLQNLVTFNWKVEDFFTVRFVKLERLETFGQDDFAQS